MPVDGKYAQVSWGGVANITWSFLKLPVILGFTLISSPFVEHNKRKSWRRVLGDRAFRWVASLPVPQCQKLFGTTMDMYKSTVAQYKLEPVVEELGENARLLWIGPKRADRVLLYLHGGAFFAPVEDCAIHFWRYVQEQLKAQTTSIELGIAILEYTLIPEASFPKPLHQALLAVNHLLASGVQPRNLYLAGDSAGGNLVGQVLLHALRPIDTIPSLNLSAPIRGAYLISPWVSLTGDTGSHAQNSHSDIITAPNLKHWGSLVLTDVPEAQRGYVEAVKAPESWFDGISKIVDRILVTAGGAECLRDDIVQFAEILQKRHNDVKLVVQKDGVHNDMFMDFLSGERKLGELTPMIIQWIAAGYDSQFS